MYDRVNWTNLGLVNIVVKLLSNSFEGEIGVVRKSRGRWGSYISKFYCIFMTKFLKSLKGVHEVTPPPPSPSLCAYIWIKSIPITDWFVKTLFRKKIVLTTHVKHYINKLKNSGVRIMGSQLIGSFR
jgi:hypothetical protein